MHGRNNGVRRHFGQGFCRLKLARISRRVWREGLELTGLREVFT